MRSRPHFRFVVRNGRAPVRSSADEPAVTLPATPSGPSRLQCCYGMLIRMAATQLAIRFTERQLETLDQLASASKTSRSAVVKRLVDQAEQVRIAALYAAAYPTDVPNVDEFGDLDEFHVAAEADRINNPSTESAW
jgi:hypothetical protein